MIRLRPGHFVVFITGPTATGKTQLAIELARHYPIDLISVDSGQVYQGLDIGTAKPDQKTLEQFPHALINQRTIDDPFSAADFAEQAMTLIRQSLERNRIPLLVGGTLFYFAALMEGFTDLPAANPALREQLESELLAHGLDHLYGRLKRIDPSAAARIDQNDRQRTLRALEINALTGENVKKRASPNGLLRSGLKVIKICLNVPDREMLHHRIAQRLDAMLEAGLIGEVEQLRACYPDARGSPAIRSVGYQQVWSFLEDEISEAQMRADILTATRRLAKRQLTWLRNDSGYVWFDALHPRLQESLETYLSGLNLSVK